VLTLPPGLRIYVAIDRLAQRRAPQALRPSGGHAPGKLSFADLRLGADFHPLNADDLLLV
jgi:hypothetical protein